MAKTNTLTVIILTKNEEKQIAQCLDSVDWADEIIIIDNGSSDKTLELVKLYNAKVYINRATDFSQLRNFGMSKARCDWILYLDADERVTPDLKSEILTIIAQFLNPAVAAAYYVQRQNYYLGKKWPYRDRMQRLFFKKTLKYWKGKVHESASIEGKYAVLTNPLLHFTHRSFEEMVEKTNNWSRIEAKLRFDAGHPRVVWWRLLRVMLTGFLDSYLYKGGIRAGLPGVAESIYQAFSMFITYAKLWELEVARINNQKS